MSEKWTGAVSEAEMSKSKRRKWKLSGEDDLYLVERNGWYSVQGTLDGTRVRKSCGTKLQSTAEMILERMKREYISGFEMDYADPNREWKEVAKLACERQEASAKNRGIPFNLKPGDVYTSMRSTGYRCAVSGIPLAKRLVLGGERDPWAPSIDRIENRHGYIVENIRVVCLVANYAMNSWGHDVLLRLARGVLRSSVIVSQEEEHEKAAMPLTPNKADTAQVIDITKQLANK